MKSRTLLETSGLPPRPAANVVAQKSRSGGKRLETSETIRAALLRAAEEVVGEIGYANASVALITQKAGVGQGTFYNYFASRQEILEALLPALGKDMFTHIKKSALGGRSFSELEDRSFRGFFDFLDRTPHFFRILNESSVFAPIGYAQHFETVSTQYMRFLRQSHANGEFPAFREDELETIVFIMMAARSYIAMRYVFGEGEQKALPESVAETYLKFVRYGLQGVPAPADSKNPDQEHS